MEFLLGRGGRGGTASSRTHQEGSRRASILHPAIFLAAAVAFLLGTGCTPGELSALAIAERYRAIAPEYGAYVADDPQFDEHEEQRNRRFRTLDAWRSDAEELAGVELPDWRRP